jgi:hypothetical protein
MFAGENIKALSAFSPVRRDRPDSHGKYWVGRFPSQRQRPRMVPASESDMSGNASNPAHLESRSKFVAETVK